MSSAQVVLFGSALVSGCFLWPISPHPEPALALLKGCGFLLEPAWLDTRRLSLLSFFHATCIPCSPALYPVNLDTHFYLSEHYSLMSVFYHLMVW